MLYNIVCNVTGKGVNPKCGAGAVARGKSGRIVLEVGVHLKNAIYDRLSDEGVKGRAERK
jgi:hypothetical protein